MTERQTGRPWWIAFWLIASVALLWPAALNRGAFWFPDSSTYIRGADAVFVTLTGRPSEWSDRIAIPAPTGAAGPSSANESAAPGPVAAGPVPHADRPVISGRSVYYGMLIYLPMRWFGPWAAIALQAMLVAAALVFSLAVATRGMAIHRARWVVGIAALLIALKPLPYYTSMLMPDIWSGVAIVLLGVAIVYRDRMSRPELFAAWSGAAAAAMFHTSHVLIAIALGLAGALVAACWKDRIASLFLGLGAGAVGLLASAIFAWGVEQRLGREPLSPPFLSARLIDAGPGMAYLDETCGESAPGERFALCELRPRLPQHSDNFLWSVQPENGVFQLAPPAMQRRIAAEDKRFFLAVVRHDPLAYAASFLASTGEALTSFGMINFNYHETRREGIARNLPPEIAEHAGRTRAVANTMPTALVLWGAIVLSAASLVVLALAGWASLRGKVSIAPATRRYAFLLVFGLVANAVVCGALSKPSARYQMRLQWVLPLAALVVLASARPAGARRAEGGRSLTSA